MTALLVGLGGVCGVMARYGIGRATLHHTDALIWSTVGINIVGSFLLGLLTAKDWFSRDVREALGVGFLGGFTTFSTFSVQVCSRSTRASPAGGRVPGGVGRGRNRRSGAGSCSAASLPEAVSTVCEHVFVRWDDLTVEAEEGRRLPGYREPAAVRTFDAPEALDIRFYEVQAKLGPQPGAEGVADAVPLDDQPLQGLHPCVHLLPAGRHAVLMADGRTKPLADLRGRRRDLRHRSATARYRRYVRHRGARPLGDQQAGLPGDARGRHRAHRQRRPPVPDRPRLEARHRRRARAAAGGRT